MGNLVAGIEATAILELICTFTYLIAPLEGGYSGWAYHCPTFPFLHFWTRCQASWQRNPNSARHSHQQGQRQQDGPATGLSLSLRLHLGLRGSTPAYPRSPPLYFHLLVLTTCLMNFKLQNQTQRQEPYLN